MKKMSTSAFAADSKDRNTSISVKLSDHNKKEYILVQ